MLSRKNDADSININNIPKQEEFETEDVGFCSTLKWLIYSKNFKQQFIRRPFSMCCKLFCPAICALILGLLRY